ncbi:MAG: hypothetical protein LBT09_06680 [Planctomycetaceae bacterium]|nr:hypothetical protein [Planctomycetaceae bacterium]
MEMLIGKWVKGEQYVFILFVTNINLRNINYTKFFIIYPNRLLTIFRLFARAAIHVTCQKNANILRRTFR